MNNDLEEFTEERLKDMQKHATAGMTLGHADALLIRQAIGIALAAKQAKPVCYADQSDIERIKSGSTTRIGSYQTNVMSIALYATPQLAHAEQAIPGGWKLVPIEPTHEMLDAGGGSFGTYDVYRDMLAAAPKPESE